MDLEDLALYVHCLIQVNANVILDASAANRTKLVPVLERLQTILAYSTVPTGQNCISDVLLTKADAALANVGDLDCDLLSFALHLSSVLALIGDHLFNYLIFVLLAAPLPLFEFQLIALTLKDVLFFEITELALLECFLCSDQGHLLLLDYEFTLEIRPTQLLVLLLRFGSCDIELVKVDDRFGIRDIELVKVDDRFFNF